MGPTSCEARQAPKMVIGYTASTLEFHQDANLLIQLGLMNLKLERLEKQQKERDWIFVRGLVCIM